jgi:hypothetical protein
MTDMSALTDITAFDRCLCCGQQVKAPGNPMTPERAERALRILTALGHTREGLLTEHRAQIDYQSPGFAEWLEAQQDLSPT